MAPTGSMQQSTGNLSHMRLIRMSVGRHCWPISKRLATDRFL